MKKYISVTKRKPLHATTLFAVSKDECNSKEDTMKNALYIQYYSMPKGTSLAEATSNSEKIKHVALTIVKFGAVC